LWETTVGDNWQRMKQVLAQAKARAGLVVTIGGLGPTVGDITKEVTAELLEKKLVRDQASEDRIRSFFAARQTAMPENNLKQALIPEGAIVLTNDRGTAPGIFTAHPGGAIINLPGPPHELTSMFENKVTPLLLERYGPQGIIHSRVLRLVGAGESTVAETLHDLIKAQGNPTIALYARQGEIAIRLTARAADAGQAKALIAGVERETRRRLPMIYGADEDTLPVLVGKTLKARRLTLALAESCTGGLVGSMLTDIPGSSEYFLGALVSYSNQAKTSLLNVDADTIAKEGAVSAAVAEMMARGAAARFAAAVGAGITGIAGPGGGSGDKPVGTAHIAVFYQGRAVSEKFTFGGDRLSIKTRTAKMALSYILSVLTK
jgi:nicotinamide-nucleotide amidase